MKKKILFTIAIFSLGLIANILLPLTTETPLVDSVEASFMYKSAWYRDPDLGCAFCGFHEHGSCAADGIPQLPLC